MAKANSSSVAPSTPHSPLPWSVAAGGTEIRDANDAWVATCCFAEAYDKAVGHTQRVHERVEKRDAAGIVAIVNSHAELLAAAKDAEIIYAEYMALGPKGYSQSFELVTRTIGAIRSAISNAEGQ